MTWADNTAYEGEWKNNKVYSNINRYMDKVNSLMLMVMFMKEVLLIINFVDKEFIYMKTVQNIQVNGLMTFNMDMALKPGLMDQNMRVIIIWDKNMEKVYNIDDRKV